MPESHMSFIDHLSELRKRIFISLFALLVGSILCYFFVEEIGQILSHPVGTLDFVYLSPPELFLVYIRLSLTGGFVLALPLILSQVCLFVLPALKKSEIFILLVSLFFGALLFVLGVFFAFSIILPLTIEFFLGYGHESIVPMFTFSAYISFVISFLLAFGLAFELPIFIIILTALGLVTPKTLRRFRKYALLLILLMSAILTPPDIISQIMLTGPMYVLFEASVLFSCLFSKKR